ncbi:permease-like cell division protein FtsX [Actinoplanes siamensis]|uniref:FtsX extracellular domain-containing protein n=1 Tax=Actinoplanes siamensis TaxID=1223317 RepID=A0A919N5C2_9ACTN|nr:permease-like cell division protein FtsX [Actinoplanes siamensis]GIF04714.1 hypothetical protein Asi03nite_22520 [Actinoplanes siamensis]
MSDFSPEEPGTTPSPASPAPPASPATPAGTGATDATDATATPEKRRGWGLPLVIALVALLAGAGAAAGGLYLNGWRQVPEAKYTMVVILKDGTSQQQKDEIQKVLEKLPGHSPIRMVSKAEAFAEAKTAYAANQEVLAGLEEDNMPESFRLSVVDRQFDCTPLKPLGGNAAISKMSVVKPYASESDPGAGILC